MNDPGQENRPDTGQGESPQEAPVLTDSQRRRILQLRRRAEAAYTKHNYRWAAELYGEIYSMDRAHHAEYLQKMLFSAFGTKNLASNPILFSIQAVAANLPWYVKSLRVKDTPEKIEEYYDVFENILRNDPDSAYATMKLSKTYEKNGLIENTAILLESHQRSRKNDIAILRKIGDLYIQIDDTQKARTYFKKILEIKPFDPDAEKKLRDLLAMTSIDESKLRGHEYQDSIKDKDFAYRAQIEMKADKTPEEYDYLVNEKKKEIARSPDNLSLRYDLLQYYREQGDREHILSTLEEIASLSAGDLNILLDRLEARIAYREEDNARRVEAGEDAAKLERELKQFKRESYEELVEQFPSNVELKFQQASVLLELDELDEALKLFQVCSRVPELYAESMNFMGRILVKKGMLDMSIDRFRDGIAKVEKMNAIKKELIYNLGLTYEKAGKPDQALEQYKLIYKEDVGYRDISRRIENAYKHPENGKEE
jgi:tetratricopeptide (TPR) repeat protein